MECNALGNDMRGLIMAATAAFLLAGCGHNRVVLPHQTMSYEDACPGYDRVRCHPDDDPRALIFNLTPPAITVENGQPNYSTFIGRGFNQPYRRGNIGRTCNTAVPSLFNPTTDFDHDSATSSFVYNYKLSSTLNAGAEVDLVAAATAAGLPPAATERVRAAARGAFNRARNRQVATQGRMRIVRLKTTVLDELRNGTGATLEPCRRFLAQNQGYAVVKAATVFHIERSSSDNQISSQIASEIKAAVQGVSADNLANVKVLSV